jgi:UV excision repair protein RAD23
MFPTLSEEERQAAAQGLGMPIEQVQQLAQLVGTLPPEQIQQMLGAHLGGGQNQPAGHVVSLTQEEMNSVHRLMELGFSQQDAAAAFLACDRNEALAANLLLEGWTAQDIAHY